MILSNNFLAVYIPPVATPPTPPAQQQNCEYSAMVNDDREHPIYQCFTQAEWDGRNAQIAQQRSVENAADKKWLHDHGWQAIWIPLLIIFSVIILKRIYHLIDKHYRPEKYRKWY